MVDIYRRAVRLGACGLFTGKEDLHGAARLMFSPQGLEFCLGHGFPSLKEFRSLDREELEKEGIYVDAGDISLSDKGNVALIGDTHAVLEYGDPTVVHKVVAMHGASAHVMATGFSVVYVRSSGCDVKTESRDYAKII